MIRSKDAYAYLARQAVAGVPTRPRKRNLAGTFRSQLEADYASHLHLRMMAGEIESYLYIGGKEKGCSLWAFALGERRRYTPDFLVWYADGRREAHEVKGHMWQRDAVRIDFFVFLYPSLPLFVVTRERGMWKVEQRKAAR